MTAEKSGISLNCRTFAAQIQTYKRLLYETSDSIIGSNAADLLLIGERGGGTDDTDHFGRKGAGGVFLVYQHHQGLCRED